MVDRRKLKLIKVLLIITVVYFVVIRSKCEQTKDVFDLTSLIVLLRIVEDGNYRSRKNIFL